MGFMAGMTMPQATLIGSLLGGGGSSGGSSGGMINPSIYQGNKLPEQGGSKTETNPTNVSNQVSNNILPTGQSVNFSGDNSNNFQSIFEQEELKRKMAGLR